MRIAILSADENLVQGLVKIFNEFSSRRLVPVEIMTFRANKNFLNSPSKFDILFLDDNNSQLGFRDTVRMCRSLYGDICIVVVSSSRDHMSEAFEFQIHRFLLKPLTSAPIYEALDSCRRGKFATRTIVVKTSAGYRSIKLSEILYVEAEKKVAAVWTTHGTISTSTPFSEILEQLPEEYFFICHRSIIINLDFIEEFSASEIKLRTGDLVPLSRRRKTEFFLSYNKFIKSHSIS